MPPKEYQFWLDENVYVVVYLWPQQRTVLEFVVKLHLIYQDKTYEVLRFDTAHGGPHKDVLHPDGSKYLVKHFLYLDNNQGLTFALDDIKEHWKSYIERFKKWLEKTGSNK